MRINWFGHAAFLIETANLRIILDPYRSPDCGGYAPINEPADIVIISHENDRYHSHLGQIVPPFEVVRALDIPDCGVDVRGLRVHAIPVFESPEKVFGDEVTVVHFRSEGRHIVFLGDLGHELAPGEIEPLRGADVVLCPAGGSPTIALEQVPSLLQAIAPRVVVPMHYWIPGKINLPIAPLERFIEVLEPLGFRVERSEESHFEVERHAKRDQTTVLCLQPAR